MYCNGLIRLAPTSPGASPLRTVVLPPPRIFWSLDITASWATTDPAGAVAPPTVRNENSTLSPLSLGESTNSNLTSPPVAYISPESKYSLKSKSVSSDRTHPTDIGAPATRPKRLAAEQIRAVRFSTDEQRR